jgi:hypothetical protein
MWRMRNTFFGLLCISLFSFGACSKSGSMNSVSGPPTISVISISSGVVGDSVTITGTNFSTIPTDNIVQFAGVTATVVSSTSTTLVVVVPPGTTSGNVTVEVNGMPGGNPQPFTVLSANVYSFGDANNGQIGAYFRNGTIAGLISNPGGSVSLSGIYVVGTDVYVSGVFYSNQGIGIPAYWKNGQVVFLPYGAISSEALGIWVSGNDVYAAGGDGTGIQYWKNRNPVSLPVTDSFSSGNTSAITVSGSDVYVAATYFTIANLNSQVSAYWKNGVQVNLPGPSSYANSIYVSGNDVYVTGYTYSAGNRTGVYWKNGVIVNLSNGTTDVVATGIYILGTDIYVAGYESGGSNAPPFYWKNGNKIVLSTPSQGAGASQGISGTGNDIYIGCEGYSIGLPTGGLGFGFWYNGTFEKITVPGGIVMNEIGGIFVEPVP